MRYAPALSAALFLFSCHRDAGPTVAPANLPGDAGADAAVAQPSGREPRRYELVQDKPVDIGGGVTARLTTVMEAHLADSKNELRMVLVITRAGTSREVSLDRLLPGAPTYVSVLGVQLAIDYVDAYHQPSTGAILVLVDGEH